MRGYRFFIILLFALGPSAALWASELPTPSLGGEWDWLDQVIKAGGGDPVLLNLAEFKNSGPDFAAIDKIKHAEAITLKDLQVLLLSKSPEDRKSFRALSQAMIKLIPMDALEQLKAKHPKTEIDLKGAGLEKLREALGDKTSLENLVNKLREKTGKVDYFANVIPDALEVLAKRAQETARKRTGIKSSNPKRAEEKSNGSGEVLAPAGDPLDEPSGQSTSSNQATTAGDVAHADPIETASTNSSSGGRGATSVVRPLEKRKLDVKRPNFLRNFLVSVFHMGNLGDEKIKEYVDVLRGSSDEEGCDAVGELVGSIKNEDLDSDLKLVLEARGSGPSQDDFKPLQRLQAGFKRDISLVENPKATWDHATSSEVSVVCRKSYDAKRKQKDKDSKLYAQYMKELKERPENRAAIQAKFEELGFTPDSRLAAVGDGPKEPLSHPEDNPAAQAFDSLAVTGPDGKLWVHLQKPGGETVSIYAGDPLNAGRFAHAQDAAEGLAQANNGTGTPLVDYRVPAKPNFENRTFYEAKRNDHIAYLDKMVTAADGRARLDAAAARAEKEKKNAETSESGTKEGKEEVKKTEATGDSSRPGALSASQQKAMSHLVDQKCQSCHKDMTFDPATNKMTKDGAEIDSKQGRLDILKGSDGLTGKKRIQMAKLVEKLRDSADGKDRALYDALKQWAEGDSQVAKQSSAGRKTLGDTETAKATSAVVKAPETTTEVKKKEEIKTTETGHTDPKTVKADPAAARKVLDPAAAAKTSTTRTPTGKSPEPEATVKVPVPPVGAAKKDPAATVEKSPIREAGAKVREGAPDRLPEMKMFKGLLAKQRIADTKISVIPLYCSNGRKLFAFFRTEKDKNGEISLSTIRADVPEKLTAASAEKLALSSAELEKDGFVSMFSITASKKDKNQGHISGLFRVYGEPQGKTNYCDSERS
jgi:hypothetical protein